MNMHVATGAVILAEKGLHLPLSEGNPAYFNYYWLRDNCPTSFDSGTRERSFDIFHLSTAPRADSAEIEDGMLVIRWAGEDHVSRFRCQCLRSTPRASIGLIPPTCRARLGSATTILTSSASRSRS